MDKLKISRERLEEILVDSCDIACELDINEAVRLLKAEGFVNDE